MSLLPTLLAGAGGGGGGSGSVTGIILSPVVAASTTNHLGTYANGSSGVGATLTNGGTQLTAARVASTGALTVTYANGTLGVGATLTNNTTQAAISIDSVALSLNDRVLIKNQAAAAQNGVYSVTTVGTGATNWVLTRVTDFDQAAEMIAGTGISVTAGTVNTGTVWSLSATITTVGTDAVTFAATAAFSIDGVSPTVGQRVLLRNQTTTFQNGVYTVTTVGSASANWVLTRATDFDQAAEMTAGTLVEVISGTVNAGTVWELTTTVATVGSSAVTFISINITTKVDQNGSPIYGLDAVGSDSYAITLSPAPAAYTTGMVVNFKAGTANTGACTLNVNSLGAKTIKKLGGGTDTATGDILSGQICSVIYDGTNFQLQSSVAATLGSASFVVQRVSTITGAVATGTTGLPLDDTIPQITEGDQFMSLAITPKASANILEIKVTVMGADSAASSYENILVALFQDSTANALAAMTGATSQFAGNSTTITFSYYMTAGTTSATTFTVRAGDPTGTFTFNGSATARLFGGVLASSIQITEYTS